MGGGVEGRERGRRGQQKGHIYFLCAVDHDDGTLRGHWRLRLCRPPRERRPKGSACLWVGAHVCVREQSRESVPIFL